MKILELKKKQLNYKDYIKRTALEKDYSTLITEPVIGVYNGEIQFIYQYIGWYTGRVVEALKKIKYQQNDRTDGLKTNSRIFGFRPRIPMRNDYCSIASLAKEFPLEHNVVVELAKQIEDIYQKNSPEVYKRHKSITDEKIKKNYKLADGVFTSGIINKNNPLKYHFDSGNFNKVYSMMPVFKSGITGGHLAIPEFDIGIELKDNSVFMFDGQGTMHGVTPIKYESPLSYLNMKVH